MVRLTEAQKRIVGQLQKGEVIELLPPGRFRLRSEYVDSNDVRVLAEVQRIEFVRECSAVRDGFYRLVRRH